MFSTRYVLAILTILQLHIDCSKNIVLPSQEFHVENFKCLQHESVNSQYASTVKRHLEVHNVTSALHCIAACQNLPNCYSVLLPVIDPNVNVMKGKCLNRSPCYLYPDETTTEFVQNSIILFCILDHINATNCSITFPCYLIPIPDSCINGSSKLYCPKDSKHYIKMKEHSQAVKEFAKTSISTNTMESALTMKTSGMTTTPAKAATTTYMTFKTENPPMDKLTSKYPDDKGATTTMKPGSTNRQKIRGSISLKYNDATTFCRIQKADIVSIESREECDQVTDLIKDCDKSGSNGDCDKSCYWLNLIWKSQRNSSSEWLVNNTMPMAASTFKYWVDDYTDPTIDGVTAYIDGANNYKWTYSRLVDIYNCLPICEMWKNETELYQSSNTVDD